MSICGGIFNEQRNPAANPKAIIKGDKYRFTVLTDRIIRIEYSEKGEFEDRATQAIVNRFLEVPEFEVIEDEENLIIRTNHVMLSYIKGRKFTRNSLSAKFTDENYTAWNIWYYGQDIRTLKGTTRTLDAVDGETELEEGLAMRNGFSVLDDSKTLLINADGSIVSRANGCTDEYLFAYSTDYYGLLRDFYKISGATPLLPRYALGNMWSRYYKYTQQEYIDLMERFKNEGCPFSVAVIDMDWHIVEECDHKYGSGWTGYTWNEKLFPDYKEFLKELHRRNLSVTLNLHPGEGVAPHEVQYKQMAEAMGVTDGSTVEFDITDPKFIENYFKLLHNPYEDAGVDFWWIDWQQGNNTKVEGLDPLWMLNHLHFHDIEKRGRRPLILSRYAGVGSHRYPLGFSGDTIMTWDSLDFQPYFTATASNVGYTWWSHDIGGHMMGIRDDELNVRWTQYGVFSPINRLHSSNNPLLGKEPWNYGEIAEKSIKKFLRLRHALVPYLYTMNYRTAVYGEPLVAPLYYKNPDKEYAYSEKHRNEYYFGTEMLVAPITKPNNTATNTAYASAWLPEGDWYDFFNNRRYTGNKTVKLYRNLYEYPVLVKAGGIVPMSGDGVQNDVSNPECLDIKVFAGADNTFELYEDDGITMGYKSGEYALTKFELKHGDKPEFIISRSRDNDSVIPANRRYRIEFTGYGKCGKFTVTCGGKPVEYSAGYADRKLVIEVSGREEIRIVFEENVEILKNDDYDCLVEIIRRMKSTNNLKVVLYDMLRNGSKPIDFAMFMNEERLDEDIRDVIMEILTAEG